MQSFYKVLFLGCPLLGKEGKGEDNFTIKMSHSWNVTFSSS